jgi:tetratricopeptide (TPR) repeat protein
LLVKELLLKGNEYYYKKDHEKALECYNKVLEIDPNLANAWGNKGIALGELERYNEAIECYNKVLEIDPKDDRAWYNKGLALRNLKKYNEAIECYDKALEIDPKKANA